jgi:hypothetical protein
MKTPMASATLALVLVATVFVWLGLYASLLNGDTTDTSPPGDGRAFRHRSDDFVVANGAEPFSFTLVTQSSPERLWLLRETCQRWTGPIVLAVYVRSADATVVADDHLWVPMPDGSKAKIGEGVCTNATVITYVASGGGGDAADAGGGERKERRAAAAADYPVNRLRNLAVAAVRTTHFFYIDIDFWPAADLEQRLVAYSAAGGVEGGSGSGNGGVSGPFRRWFAAERSAIVVPAFDLLAVSKGCPYADHCRQTYQRTAPRTFPQLQKCLDDRGCQVRGARGTLARKSVVCLILVLVVFVVLLLPHASHPVRRA